MSGTNKREFLRPLPPMRVRPGPSANSVILYTVGKSVRKKDCRELQYLLDRFNFDEALVTYKLDVRITSSLW